MRLSEFGAEAIEYDLTAEYPSEAVKRTSTCWPATCPGQSETSSVIVRAVAVSSCKATTVPTRHITRRPNNAAPAMGPHKYGSRDSPKSRVCRVTSASSPSPIWRSSKNKGEGREVARGRRVRGQDLHHQI